MISGETLTARLYTQEVSLLPALHKKRKFNSGAGRLGVGVSAARRRWGGAPAALLAARYVCGAMHIYTGV